MEDLSTGTADYSDTGYDVYVKDLANGSIAVSVTNRSGFPIDIPAIKLTDLYLKSGTRYDCHEIWSNSDSRIEDELPAFPLAPFETKVYVMAESLQQH